MTVVPLIAAFRRSAWLVTVWCAVVMPAAAAEAVKPADVRAIKGVVQAQLAAFARDDAPGAFSHAAPAIREMFGTPQRFMAMVQSQYPMVHRPASVSFLQPHGQGSDVLQRVQLTDAEGANWIASYLMLRGKDGRWRIGGCTVAPAAQRLNT